MGPSPLTKMTKVEIFMIETFILQTGFRSPSNALSIMYLYREQIVTDFFFFN